MSSNENVESHSRGRCQAWVVVEGEPRRLITLLYNNVRKPLSRRSRLGFVLIASDLDGTLFRDDLSLSPRTVAAIAAATAAGITVVPATARPTWAVRELISAEVFGGWAVCTNGALGIHLGTGEVLVEELLETVTQEAISAALLARYPGTVFASVRDRGEGFFAQHGYFEHADPADHGRSLESHGAHDLSEVLGAPSLKLIARHPEVPPRALYDAALESGVTGFEASLSGAPFVEINRAGVNKGTGLAKLAEKLGIAQADTVAFGDAMNDIPMLAWAGVGVAMGNADDAVKAAADRVTETNLDDGVAIVIEELTAAG